MFNPFLILNYNYHSDIGSEKLYKKKQQMKQM